ncbi:MAG: hypothetical protein JWL72_3925 [Ilumatobacteraceae bacterium]|nr:hypothetical protein [Ilumatobacteraceae bacterium]
MDVVIRGHDLPGRMFRVAAVPVHNVHAGVQVREVAEQLVPGDAPSATWTLDVRVKVADGGGLDFAGPAVHGRRGERFLYITWGDVGADGGFAMFRRAKLMLDAIDTDLVRAAQSIGHRLVATIGLTDAHGGPRCARVDPPALQWTAEPSR